jgi:hypothetical protein
VPQYAVKRMISNGSWNWPLCRIEKAAHVFASLHSSDESGGSSAKKGILNIGPIAPPPEYWLAPHLPLSKFLRSTTFFQPLVKNVPLPCPIPLPESCRRHWRILLNRTLRYCFIIKLLKSVRDFFWKKTALYSSCEWFAESFWIKMNHPFNCTVMVNSDCIRQTQWNTHSVSVVFQSDIVVIPNKLGWYSLLRIRSVITQVLLGLRSGVLMTDWARWRCEGPDDHCKFIFYLNPCAQYL